MTPPANVLFAGDPYPGGDAAHGADELFRSHQQHIYRKTDQLFSYLLVVQWFAGIAFALWVSPLAWYGGASRVHLHVWTAVFLGGGIALFPAVLAWRHPGQAPTRYSIAVAQMLMGALLIHLNAGRIETHFHVFGSLAFLAFYRDWRVLVPATIVVALDHLLRGLYWPESVYGVVVASQWRWAEHAAWVLVEDVVLVMSCLRGTHELRQIADRTAVLQQAHLEQARHSMELTDMVTRLRITQQEAEAATRAKSEFVANMSHELRTPLNIITLYSEMLHEGAVDDARRADAEDLLKITQSSKHLLTLVNGLLDLSKVEAGKMELALDSFDVAAMVRELSAAIDPVVTRNGNRFALALGDELGDMHSDVTKTRQILYNLLSNAAKFTKDGSVSLQVRRTVVDGRDWLEFVVTDSGIGLTPEQQAKLFRPFVQADASITRQYGGTGLGLALVWRFCLLMRGQVVVESESGRGSRFTVLLPADVRPAGQPAAAAA